MMLAMSEESHDRQTERAQSDHKQSERNVIITSLNFLLAMANSGHGACMWGHL